MPSDEATRDRGAVVTWSKRCYIAGRAAMEGLLRPQGLGASQWFVLRHLAENGPTLQRDLLRALQVERPTLSAIVAALVGKNLIEQQPDGADQRQKLLQLTDTGRRLWGELPDLGAIIHQAAFVGISAADLETTARVLRTATAQLDRFNKKGISK